MQDDEAQIRQLVADWMAATRAADADKVLSLVTDDVVFLLPGRVMRHAEFAAATRAQAAGSVQVAAVIDGASDIQEIQVLGEWAFVWTNLTVNVTPRGASTTTRAGHTLTLFRKQGGKWLLARDANLLAPACR